MKNLRQKIVAMAAVVAVSGLMMASVAGAADKLIVKDAAGTTNVFVVDDTGMITGKKIGMGTSTPQAPIHLNLTTDPVGTALYSVSSGFVASRSGGAAAGDFTSAAPLAGQRGIVRGVRARGTLESPTAPLVDDQVFSVLGGVYVGPTLKVLNMADITMKVDGTVTEGATSATSSAPVRITFSTRTGDTWYERLTIKSGGNIGINTPDPKSILHVTGLQVFTSNDLAKAAGLTAGAFYTDGAGNVKVVY